MKDLDSTVELMLSDNHKDRLKAEYYQAKIRYQKLNKMIMKFDNNTLGFVPACPIGVLMQQAYILGEYLQILERRAEIEQVEL